MKFNKTEFKKIILYLIRLVWQGFSKFPGWAKILTVLIFLGLILEAWEGVNVKFKELTQPSQVAVNASVDSPGTDPFSDGVNKATNAAKLTQTAQTLDEWNQVADEWQAAINFMKAVSPTNQNYEAAQQRIITYPNNLAYAQKNAENLKQKESKLQQSQIIRGQEIFKDSKGIYKVWGAGTNAPFVNVIIPKTGWDKLSKADQVSLTMYAESLISVIKSNPGKYVDRPPSSSAYNSFIRSKIPNICQDCWSIMLSYTDSQPYSTDVVVVQGDSLWKQQDPCCRGVNASKFR